MEGSCLTFGFIQNRPSMPSKKPMYAVFHDFAARLQKRIPSRYRFMAIGVVDKT